MTFKKEQPMDDRVLHVQTRMEGYIAADMTGVAEEDDFGDVNMPESPFVWVSWDHQTGLPTHVDRLQLRPIAGYRITEPSNAHVGAGYISEVFISREEAEAYRGKTLEDSEGKRYRIFPVDKSGAAL
jgi:hypothetical protein